MPNFNWTDRSGANNDGYYGDDRLTRRQAIGVYLIYAASAVLAGWVAWTTLKSAWEWLHPI